MLLGLIDVALGEGQAVDCLRVPGIGLIGAAQVVESPQAALLLAVDRALFMRATGLLGSAARACMEYSLACGRSPNFR